MNVVIRTREFVVDSTEFVRSDCLIDEWKAESAILDETVRDVPMATAKPHKYSLECFIRDMEPIMDSVKDRPIADQVESLLDHLMEGAGFLDDTDRTKLGESGFSQIEHVRHIMKTGQTRAQITSGVEPLLKTVRKRRYLGTSRFCPVCESRLRECFLFGPDKRCPVCGSLERHRLIWLFMHQKTTLFTPPKKKILHIAPEPCLASILQESENIDYVSTDFTLWAMIQSDLTQLCFPNDIFDAVYASHVLEHVLDDRSAMREIYRILRPGGWAILQVPISKRKVTYEDPTIIDSDKREQAFGQRDHVRVYGEDYYDRLREAGFTVHIKKLLLQTIQSAVQRFGLNPGEQISYCIKPPYSTSALTSR